MNRMRQGTESVTTQTDDLHKESFVATPVSATTGQIEYAAAERIAVAAARRTPRYGRLGMFCREVGRPHSIGTFFWFDSVESLQCFVREALVVFHTPDACLSDPVSDKSEGAVCLEDISCSGHIDGAELARIVPDLGTTNAGERDSRREALNVCLAGIVSIEWWGTFADIVTGTDPFACYVQRRFLRDSPSEWIDPKLRQISPSDHPSFRRFLYHYGG